MTTDARSRPGREAFHSQALVHLVVAGGWRLLTRFLYRPRIIHHPAYRRDGLYIYAANHRSFYDPPLVAMFTRYANGFFARASLWKLPFVGQLLWLVGGIPVDRSAPGMESMRKALRVLNEGRSLLVFPEGTRTRTGRLGPFKEGPALMARRADVPVVPVYVHRTDEIWPRGALVPRLSSGLTMVYGPPLRAPSHLRGRASDRWLTAAIRRWHEIQERRFLGPGDG